MLFKRRYRYTNSVFNTLPSQYEKQASVYVHIAMPRKPNEYFLLKNRKKEPGMRIKKKISNRKKQSLISVDIKMECACVCVRQGTMRRGGGALSKNSIRRYFIVLDVPRKYQFSLKTFQFHP